MLSSVLIPEQKEFIKNYYFLYYHRGCPAIHEKEWNEITEIQGSLLAAGGAVFFHANGLVETINEEILFGALARERNLTGIFFDPVTYTLAFRIYEEGEPIYGRPVTFSFS